MKNSLLVLTTLVLLVLGTFTITSCTDDNPGTSATELLAKKFDAAPVLDGEIDDIWSKCQVLENTAVVPDAGPRQGADFNGDGSDAPVGVFDPYTGESNNFELRAGTHEDNIYFLLTWDDAEDSKDRESWYFDDNSGLWKTQHKYANNDDDKYYEDKFSFLFAANEVEGFAANTCYATCHQGLSVNNPGHKAARHYTNNEGEIVDMWHWKRVRSTYGPTRVDDQQQVYKEHTGDAGQNGRKGDAGTAGYHTNSQKLLLDGSGEEVSVPKYVIPGAIDTKWYTIDDVNNGTAKEVTGVSSTGVLYYDGGSINPADGGFENGTGNKRFASVWVENFTGSRGDIDIAAIHTGSGWVCEFTRKMNTGFEDDVQFDVTKDFPFGLAIFNNAAIAHEIKTNLLLTFEQ
jgi:hypothetical protein